MILHMKPLIMKFASAIAEANKMNLLKIKDIIKQPERRQPDG